MRLVDPTIAELIGGEAGQLAGARQCRSGNGICTATAFSTKPCRSRATRHGEFSRQDHRRLEFVTRTERPPRGTRCRRCRSARRRRGLFRQLRQRADRALCGACCPDRRRNSVSPNGLQRSNVALDTLIQVPNAALAEAQAYAGGGRREAGQASVVAGGVCWRSVCWLAASGSGWPRDGSLRRSAPSAHHGSAAIRRNSLVW